MALLAESIATIPIAGKINKKFEKVFVVITMKKISIYSITDQITELARSYKSYNTLYCKTI